MLVYNDALFTKEDWKNIQMLKRSDKRSDPFKIGKFGIGFNSVFHVTGNEACIKPCFLSIIIMLLFTASL